MNFRRRILEGDLHEWGDACKGIVRGLSSLGVTGVASFKNGYMGLSEHQDPNYWPRSRIYNINHAIYRLEHKYIEILELIYIERLSYREIARKGISKKSTTCDMVKEAKDLLMDSKYWAFDRSGHLS